MLFYNTNVPVHEIVFSFHHLIIWTDLRSLTTELLSIKMMTYFIFNELIQFKVVNHQKENVIDYLIKCLQF